MFSKQTTAVTALITSLVLPGCKQTERSEATGLLTPLLRTDTNLVVQGGAFNGKDWQIQVGWPASSTVRDAAKDFNFTTELKPGSTTISALAKYEANNPAIPVRGNPSEIGQTSFTVSVGAPKNYFSSHTMQVRADLYASGLANVVFSFEHTTNGMTFARLVPEGAKSVYSRVILPVSIITRDSLQGDNKN